jgi:hypothetical protein
MGNKRRPSAHQKQIRFFTIFFGVIFIAVAVAILLMLNRPPGGIR